MTDQVQPEDGAAIPTRPPVITATDEWLSRISDQLDKVLAGQTQSAASSTAAASTGVRGQGTKKTTQKPRAEVRGD